MCDSSFCLTFLRYASAIYKFEFEFALEFTVRPGYSLRSHTEKVGTLMFKKYFKILLVSKSYHLKQQSSH